MIEMNLNEKQAGIVLLCISILLFAVLFSFTAELMDAAEIQCNETCGPEMDGNCPHAKSIPLQSYLGFTFASVLAFFSVMMVGNKINLESPVKKMKIKRAKTTLKGDKKEIYELIKDSGGAIFQGDLVEKTDFSKAKVSRLLDKLEGQGLVERKRRGMSNMVVLKQ